VSSLTFDYWLVPYILQADSPKREIAGPALIPSMAGRQAFTDQLTDVILSIQAGSNIEKQAGSINDVPENRRTWKPVNRQHKFYLLIGL